MAWVVVGLGNPGEDYEMTRHNAGRMAVERFAEKNRFSPWKSDAKKKATTTRGALGRELVACVLPDTFMNRSGAAVAPFVKPARPGPARPGSVKAAKKLIVVYDDLDLPLGTMKVSFDRSSGGHKGVHSIERAVKTRAFARVRIGVVPSTASGKPKKPQGEKAVEDFILGAWKPHEHGALKPMLERAAGAIETIITHGVPHAMNEYNTKQQ